MGRPRIGGNRPKVKIGISLDAELYAWIAERTGPGREFASISHGIERSIANLQRADEPQGHGHGSTPARHSDTHTGMHGGAQKHT